MKTRLWYFSGHVEFVVKAAGITEARSILAAWLVNDALTAEVKPCHESLMRGVGAFVEGSVPVQVFP